MKSYKRKRFNIVNGSLTGLKTLILVLVLLIWMFGDSTVAGWAESNPYIMVRATNDWVDGNSWPVGVLVTLTIDNPVNGGGVDYTDTQDVTESGQFRFKIGDYFDIQPGHFVVVTDEETTKEHIVTNLAVTFIDTESDTVWGIAVPGDEIDVSVWGPVNCEIIVWANEFGGWSADFSICNVDIVPGTGVGAQERDVDGDYTSVDWRIPVPYILVWPLLDMVHSFDWTAEAEVTLTIDDLDTPEEPDYTDTQTVFLQPGNPTQTLVRFEGEGMFDVQPGNIVVVTDGVFTKEHIVTNLEVTSVDVYSDTVSGTAYPYSKLEVSVSDPFYCWIEVFADESGNWSADFSEYVDIVPGSWGGAQEHDGDGDVTVENWPLPNEPPVALCKDIEISVDENCESYIVPGDIDRGSYDPDGDSITLSVDKSGPFSPGVHTVNLTVTDENEASTTCQASVTVNDTTPPEISVSVSPNTLQPPNHKMVLINLDITASDTCDFADPTVVLTSITMNEEDETNTYDPNYDSTVGDGNTIYDIQVDDDGNIYLRAERSGKGTGRIYAITYTATDASGNSATATTTVTVPHDQK